jgi:endonuclease YncB( thermonuclease family)
MSGRVAVIAFTVLGAAAVARAQALPPGSGPVDLPRFVRVIDGDTFEVYIQGRQTGIGLIGIRAPMGNTPCGKAATGFLRALLNQRTLRVEEDQQIAFDARKRRMYYLRIDGQQSAAVEMARAGFATPDGTGIEAAEILAAARDAADAGRGCVTRSPVQ